MRLRVTGHCLRFRDWRLAIRHQGRVSAEDHARGHAQRIKLQRAFHPCASDEAERPVPAHTPAEDNQRIGLQVGRHGGKNEGPALREKQVPGFVGLTVRLSPGRRAAAVVVELIPISGFARREPFAVAGAAAIVSLLEITSGLLWITGGLARACQIVVGAADFSLRFTFASHVSPRGWGRPIAIKLRTIYERNR